MHGCRLEHVAGTIRVRLACFFACCLMALSGSVAGETITLTGGEKFVQSAYGKWLEQVYKEAFRRIGYDLAVVGYPSQRAIIMADKAEVDGQLERGYDFSVEHPNLLRVEEPTNTEAYCAYAAKPNVSIKGWEGLRKGNYVVVARRGIGKSIESLMAILPKEQLTFVERPEQGLQMLLFGRADVYIDYAPVVTETLNSLRKGDQADSVSAIYQAGIMAYTTHHAFLHKKHQALVPKLSRALREMKREGLFEKLRAQQ